MFEIILKDTKGNELGRFPCKGKSCSIGRSAKNLVALKGWRIASTHAEIQTQSKGLYVVDTSGGIGLRVNGSAASSFGPLSSKDEIQIGNNILFVEGDAVSSPQASLLSSVEEDDDSPQASLLSSVEEDDDVTEPVKPVAMSPPSPVVKATTDVKEDKKQSFADEESRYYWHYRIHQKLMLAMDLRRTDVASLDDTELRLMVSELIDEIIIEIRPELPIGVDTTVLAREVLDEAVGLGPIEMLLADDSVSEIMVNGYENIYVERAGRLEKSFIGFSGDNAVLAVIERIVAPLGRRIDESSPMVDGRLQDGSRINAVIPPLALNGPTLTIRKFFKRKLSVEDLVGFGALSEDMAEFLEAAVQNKKNIIISGGTGSGKTTFLNVLSNYIPHNERIITVEDSAELTLGQPHVVSLEGRPANMEGSGGVAIRDLVKNCLRMRPDRIVVGECRGGEALDMLQAMNTGHDGSLTTAHANTPRDLMARLGVMVMMAGMDLPDQAIKEQIASAINIVVQQSRFSDGSRKITHIAEITGMESGTVQMQNIFVFKQTGFDEEGRVRGAFKSTGRVPEFYEDLRSRGIDVNMSIFSQEA